MWPWRKKKEPKLVFMSDGADPDHEKIRQLTQEEIDRHNAALNGFRNWLNMEKEKEMRTTEFNHIEDKITLKNVKLNRCNNEWGAEEFSLRLVYEIDNKYARSELIIPRLVLPINPYNFITSKGVNIDTGRHEHYADIGFGNFELRAGTGHDPKSVDVYTVKTLEEHPQKMTVADIEKKLGYKIEIVSEESEG